jgi:penicillin-binding protein 1A
MLRFLFNTLLASLLIAMIGLGGGLWYLAPQLPPIETLKDVRLQVPLKVYSQDHTLIGEFGEKHRTPIKLEEVPETLIRAVLAAEDDRFYDHPGVDWQAILRAAISLARTGEKTQGGSTITMQVARNFFLTSEKTYLRKLNEILLALKIERELSKDEILELYLNKIYLGQRAYGVAAAAEVYYGANLQKLTLPELAMIAGLPKAPSALNPVTNPMRAVQRRNYVLRRMRELNYISQHDYKEAWATQNTASLHGHLSTSSAPYVAEMVRNYMLEQYGKDAYESEYRVYTTISDRLQDAARDSVHANLMDYDRRHGYRGPEHRFTLSKESTDSEWSRLQTGFRPIGDLHPALITEVNPSSVTAFAAETGLIELKWSGMSWARPYIDENSRGASPKKTTDVVKPGDVVRIQRTDDGGWRLTQIPKVEGALVSLDPNTGAVLALVGGFDFSRSKFNRVTQARRQPGSGFKPFLYSAALDVGYTAASFVNDAPIEFAIPELDKIWRPQNYTRNFRGPMRLREALAHSRNLVSIRLLQSIGIKRALKRISRFGFSGRQVPRNFSLALGTGVMTPMELISGYTIFANGGFPVQPNFIARIEKGDGEVVEDRTAQLQCAHCVGDPGTGAPETTASAGTSSDQPAPPPLPQRAISAENAWIISSMLQDVIKYGTGKAARVLGRNDLSGKTGTTNDQRDAWFTGYNSRIVTTAWIGFDDNQPLGDKETGGKAALPMWIQYMKTALDGMPESTLEQPTGLVTARIDPNTGSPTSAGDPRGIFEVFSAESKPSKQAPPNRTETRQDSLTEQLF